MKCRQNTESKKWELQRQKRRKPIFLSKFEVSGSKKLRSIKEQEASGLLLLGPNSPLNKIKILGAIS